MESELDHLKEHVQVVEVEQVDGNNTNGVL